MKVLRGSLIQRPDVDSRKKRMWHGEHFEDIDATENVNDSYNKVNDSYNKVNDTTGDITSEESKDYGIKVLIFFIGFCASLVIFCIVLTMQWGPLSKEITNVLSNNDVLKESINNISKPLSTIHWSLGISLFLTIIGIAIYIHILIAEKAKLEKLKEEKDDEIERLKEEKDDEIEKKDDEIEKAVAENVTRN